MENPSVSRCIINAAVGATAATAAAKKKNEEEEKKESHPVCQWQDKQLKKANEPLFIKYC